MSGRSRVLTIGLPVVAALVLGAALVSVGRHGAPPVAAEPHTTPATLPAEAKGEVIGAVGLVESASEEIGIGTHVSGVVAEVAVRPGAQVRAGDELFALDGRANAADIEARRQDLAAAEARLADLIASVSGIAAQVRAAHATVSTAETDLADAQDLERMGNRLSGTAGITEREAVHRRFAAHMAASRLEEARAKLAQSEAELARYRQAESDGPAILTARAVVAQARAALGKSETDRDLLVARAPIDGTVLQVNIRSGEFAQAGMVSTALVVMGNIATLHVRIDIDEADIPRFRRGAKAWASPRGAARLSIPLDFVRIDPLVVPKRALTGAGTERVDTRVLRVIYAFDPKSLPIFPGQQVDVFIDAVPSI